MFGHTSFSEAPFASQVVAFEQGPVAGEAAQAEVWWPIVLRERRKRRKREVEIAKAKLRKARASAKRKITLHIRKGAPVTESALMKLVETSVSQAAPTAPKTDKREASLDILVSLTAHIQAIAEEEDTIAFLLM